MKTAISPKKQVVTKTETPKTYKSGKAAGEAKARQIEKVFDGADWSTFKKQD